MHFAFIRATALGSVDTTLRDVAETLKRQGKRVIGVVQEPTGAADRHRCDMDLIDLASGRRLSISQNLGAGSKGCRLDGSAIEAAAARVEADLEYQGADLLVINRFGKMEAAGRGFRPVVARALDRGLPVLVGVNNLNLPAFSEFAGSIVSELPDLPSAILAWVRPILRQAAA